MTKTRPGARRITESALIRRVAEALARFGTLEAGLAAVIPLVSRFVGSDHGVFVVSPSADRRLVIGDGRASGSDDPALAPAARRFEEATPVLNGLAFPVRIKRRCLGYGIFRGENTIRPTPGALGLLNAVGTLLGAFCEAVTVNERMKRDRDRLARANEELDFLLRLNAALGACRDTDGLFKWLCREIGRFVPCRGIEIVSLAGSPVILSSGVPQPGSGMTDGAYARTWSDRLKSRHGIREIPGDLTVKRFAWAAAGTPRRPVRSLPDAGVRTWESPLTCGDEPVGAIAVHSEGPLKAGGRADRILRAAAARIGTFIRNSAEHEKVRSLAIHDCLTGLLNYMSFQDIFERELARYRCHGRNFALLLVDLDNFKRVNDTFGHQAGDDVLRRVAAIVKARLRKTDYAFRYGGDEFVVLMAETDAARAAILAERICASIRRETVGVPPCGFSLTASIGIVDCSATASKEREEMLLRADEALYQAKNDGRDRIRVSPKPPGPSPAGKPPVPRPDPSRRIRRTHGRGRGLTIRSRRAPGRMKPPASPAYLIL